MSPRVVTVLTFVAAGIVVGLYVLFVVWRYRVEKRKKAMEEPAADRRQERVLERLGAAPPAPDPDEPVPEVTVADLLTGIRMPADLVPVITSVDADAGRQVTFWTRAAPTTVEQGFSAELKRLGFTVTTQKDDTMRAERDGDVVVSRVHLRPTFTGVPEDAIVLEVWVEG